MGEEDYAAKMIHKGQTLMYLGVLIIIIGPFIAAMIVLPIELGYIVWSGYSGTYFCIWTLVAMLMMILIGLVVYLRGRHFWLKYGGPRKKETASKLWMPRVLQHFVNYLMQKIVGKYRTYRRYPRSDQVYRRTKDKLLNALQTSGYVVVAKKANSIIAERGESEWQVLDSLSLRKFVSLYFNPVTRAHLTQQVRHTLTINLKKSYAVFTFAFPGQILGSLDKAFLEKIIDNLVNKWFIPKAPKFDLYELTENLKKLKNIYLYINTSAKFCVYSLTWFGIPAAVAFAATLAGWKARIFIDDFLVLESPIGLVVDWRVWKFQILFVVSLLVILIFLGFFVEMKISNVFKELRRKARKTHPDPTLQGIAIRKVVDEAGVYPKSRGVFRFLLLIFSPVVLFIVVLLALLNVTPIIPLILFFVAMVPLGTMTNVFSMPKSIELLKWKTLDLYGVFVTFLSLIWFFLWYDSYLLSWTFFDTEFKDIFFVALYAGILIGWSASFFLSELRLLYPSILRFLYGENVPGDGRGVLASILSIFVYAATIKITFLQVPLLDVTTDPSRIEMFQIVNGALGLWTKLFSSWLPLVLTIFVLIITIRSQSIRIKLSWRELTKFFTWFTKERLADVTMFVAGSLLIATKGFFAIVMTIPVIPSLLFTATLVVALCLIILSYRRIGRTTRIDLIR